MSGMSAESSDPVAVTKGRGGRELLWGLGGFLLFLLLGLGVILMSDPGGAGLALFSGESSAKTSLALTLLHTNDTWGYIDTCGG